MLTETGMAAARNIRSWLGGMVFARAKREISGTSGRRRTGIGRRLEVRDGLRLLECAFSFLSSAVLPGGSLFMAWRMTSHRRSSWVLGMSVHGLSVMMVVQGVCTLSTAPFPSGSGSIAFARLRHSLSDPAACALRTRGGGD